jgi:hypothetical protein
MGTQGDALCDGDGCVPELYHALWQKNKSGRSCPGVNLPETVRHGPVTPACACEPGAQAQDCTLWLGVEGTADENRKRGRRRVSVFHWVWEQSVATPRSARGWARPPRRHFKIQSCSVGGASRTS